MSQKSKIIIAILCILAAAGAFVAYYFYHSVFASNVQTKDNRIIYIASGSKLSDVIHTIDTSQILKNTKTFIRVAQWMKYGDAQIAPGKYTIKEGWNNRQIVGLLRSGNQTPINLVINNVRRIQDLTGKIGIQVEADSNAFLEYFSDPTTIQKYEATRRVFFRYSFQIPIRYFGR
ncbi:MAG: endolytic transglycosylase MltG [Saprospiraceae bacterium]|nr:endolytic transglycosylase MltG [Saprospiraceae bacterium]